VLVLPAVNMLDLSGPVQVLSTANHYGGRYEIKFVAASPSMTLSSATPACSTDAGAPATGA
jgi:transcriptional regulator GlxA family with amidase domain